MDRPPADPAKLLEAWMAWERGEEMPGRTMSTLKTGGLRDLLEAMVADRAAGAGGPGAAAPDADGAPVETGTWTPVV